MPNGTQIKLNIMEDY